MNIRSTNRPTARYTRPGTRQKGDRVYTPVSLPDTPCKRLCTLGRVKLDSNALNPAFVAVPRFGWRIASQANVDRGRMSQPSGEGRLSRPPSRRGGFSRRSSPFSIWRVASQILHNGVVSMSGGATRNRIPSEQSRLAKRTYKLALPGNLSPGEYAFLAPGLTNSSASGSTGKAYTFRIVE